MKRDRRSVRDIRRKISVNEYDVERIERILDATGGEEARVIYRAFKRGLDELERSIEHPRDNKNRLATCA